MIEIRGLDIGENAGISAHTCLASLGRRRHLLCLMKLIHRHQSVCWPPWSNPIMLLHSWPLWTCSNACPALQGQATVGRSGVWPQWKSAFPHNFLGTSPLANPLGDLSWQLQRPPYSEKRSLSLIELLISDLSYADASTDHGWSWEDSDHLH